MSEKKHKHILKLCSDQHSPVVAGYAGDGLVRTPNMDRLAANGTVFENHYCNSPVCTPGRYSMLTGRMPGELNTFGFSDILPLDTHTYMRHFSQHGYQTTCVGKMHFHGPEQMYGWMYRPFGDMEVYDSSCIPGYSAEKDICHGVKKAKEIQKKNIRAAQPGGKHLHRFKTAGPGEDQFMIFDKSATREAVINLKNYFKGTIDLKYFGSPRPLLYEVSWKTPHNPFVGLPELYAYYRDQIDLPKKRVTSDNIDNYPPALRERIEKYMTEEITDEMIRNARAAYYALVEFTDRQIGIVLDALEELEILDDFYIMYTSDHGEMAGEHGLWDKNCFYEESVRIPMILSGFDVPKGKKVTANTSHLDIFPTLCDMGNLPTPADLKGRSLLPMISEDTPDERIVLSERHIDISLFMAKYKNIKYVEYTDGNSQLFDLEKDPAELDNKTADQSYKTVKQRLQQEIAALPKPEK
jgi:choline-sulfatase